MKQKTSKNEQPKFQCKICDYACKSKFNLKRHFSSTRHKMKQNETQNEQKRAKKQNTPHFSCDYCARIFKSRTSIWRHKKKCGNKTSQNIPNIVGDTTSSPLGNVVLVDKLVEVFEKQIITTNKLIDKISSIQNITNNNCNNKMTINMYLNNECKNAMNLKDFVDKVTVSIEDLKYTTKHGYIKGMSNVLVKRLTDMDPKERPIHCSDKKRMQFYVKEEDKWEKDKKHEKIDHSISSISIKHLKKVREWEDAHPNFMDCEELKDKYLKMIHNIVGGATSQQEAKNKSNIKKEISNVIEVKDAMNT